MKKNSQNKTPKKHVLGRLIKYMFKSFPREYTVCIVLLLFTTVASIANTVFIKFLVESIVEPFSNKLITFDQSLNKLLVLTMIMLGIYLTGIVCSFIYNRTIGITGQKFSAKIREDMFKNMERLPISYFDTHKYGNIMSTYTNDIDHTWELFTIVFPQLLTNFLTILVLFCIMLFYSIYLALVVLGFSVIMLIVSKVCAGRSSKAFLRQQHNIARLEGFAEEMFSGMKVIKVFNHEKETQDGFDEINEIFYKCGRRGNIFSNILMPVLGNLGHILYICIALIGALMITLGTKNLTIMGFDAKPVELGVIISFLLISRQFTGAVGHSAQQVNSLVLGLAAATRIYDLLDQSHEVDDGYVKLVNCEIDENGNIIETDKRTGKWAWKHPHSETNTVTYTPLEGDILLQDVDFRYNEHKMVLKNISIYAHAGQKIALVGATGAGKTTITNLLNRFYDIADGKIRYDGININKIKKDDLRRSLGVVLQDVNLFTDTIMENIRYGRLDATDEECIEAAKLANAHDFITRLPQGYNTMLKGDGANLSQGQRQLLSIARAAVANPPVLILDEATSSIDTRTESLVQKGMDGLMKGRTVFVIAHRLSTIRNSDAIMVLDKGEIIERGNHEQLIAKKGLYYQLYTGKIELE